MALVSIDRRSNLTHLYLDNNQIEDEGAEFLVKALKNNTILEYLYLTNNRIRY
jgi:Leucine-rich repeat (LRR) protein